MTATAKQIDWNKPVQARYADGSWSEVRVLATDCWGPRPIAVLVDRSPDTGLNVPALFAMPDMSQYGAWQFRNTPAPPVTFEFTRYVNVRRRDDGTFHDGGQVYADADSAARGLSTEFVTVPVTIRGEWKDGESNG